MGACACVCPARYRRITPFIRRVVQVYDQSKINEATGAPKMVFRAVVGESITSIAGGGCSERGLYRVVVTLNLKDS